MRRVATAALIAAAMAVPRRAEPQPQPPAGSLYAQVLPQELLNKDATKTLRRSPG